MFTATSGCGLRLEHGRKGQSSLPLAAGIHISAIMLQFLLTDWSLPAVFTKLVWLAQLALLVHVLRTGRPYWWLLVLFFAPVLGGLIYFFVEVLPGWRWEDPTGGWRPRVWRIREARNRVEETGTVKARLELAALLLAGGDAAAARETAEDCLRGVYRDDPVVLAEVARYRLETGDAVAAFTALDQANPLGDRRLAVKLALLRGRACLLQGRHDEAQALFAEAEAGHLGDEPRYFRALSLHQSGRTAEAREIWEEMRRHFRRAGRAWARTERKWFQLASQRLRETRPR